MPAIPAALSTAGPSQHLTAPRQRQRLRQGEAQGSCERRDRAEGAMWGHPPLSEPPSPHCAAAMRASGLARTAARSSLLLRTCCARPASSTHTSSALTSALPRVTSSQLQAGTAGGRGGQGGLAPPLSSLSLSQLASSRAHQGRALLHPTALRLHPPSALSRPHLTSRLPVSPSLGHPSSASSDSTASAPAEALSSLANQRRSLLAGGGVQWGSSGGAPTKGQGAGLPDMGRRRGFEVRAMSGEAGTEAPAKKKRGKGGEGKEKEEAGGQYKGTLNLPETTFGMRANSTEREPQIQQRWDEMAIAEKLQETNPGEVFTLHDGPPYANGDLHIGHALNKILKDIINRYQIMQGRKVRYIPGWDCHGLPIELKVLQSMDSKARQELTPIKLRKKAAQFARKTVDKQRESFKRYGIWGAWDEPYLTLQPEYEAAQVGVFGAMFLQGHIYRGRKPVHWSPSSRTALAEAELEYPEGHASRSMYASFPLHHLSPALAQQLPQEVKEGDLGVAIWTTTPWTILGNAAVAVNDKLEYAVVRLCPPLQEEAATPAAPAAPAAEEAAATAAPEALTAAAVTGAEAGGEAGAAPAAPAGPRFGKGNRNPGAALRSLTEAGAGAGEGGPAGAGGSRFLVVGRDLVEKLEDKWRAHLEVVCTVAGSALEGCKYRHPLETERECPVVIGGDYITTESGTGLVHTAPGHGQEDYATGLKYGLPLLSPVDDKGHFTAEAGEQFQGMDVLGDGNVAIMGAMDACGSLLLEERYEHKYPYDWRTKKPTIFRATDQWFASVAGFRDAALAAIRAVEWVPAQGEKRITAMTEDRSDWCISRQRSWGVPIPVFYHKETGEPLLSQETLHHIQEVIRAKGSDAWYEMEVEELLPESLRGQAGDYVKGTDTMDVWFDSGSSWAAVLQQRGGVQWPADLYLEGSDQHRGWFQSSLLTSIAAQGCAPYKRVLTHGFVLDERGFKMSKSLGNVVDPSSVINGGKNQKTEPAYGADVLRLWVSSVDYSSDVSIGPGILRQIADVYRKLRGTLRFMLGNLDGFQPETDLVAYEDLPALDQHALFRLAAVMEEVRRGYEDFQFFKVSQVIQRFSVVDLSNFYFDICKDRLYVGGRSSRTRRACQTVLYHHTLCMLGALAPVLPHLAEDGWENLPFPVHLPSPSQGGEAAGSVFQALWPQVPEGWGQLSESEATKWATLLQVRAEVNRVMELARAGKLIGANLDARVYLHTPSPALRAILAPLSDEGGQLKEGEDNAVDTLRAIFLSSQACLVGSPEEAQALGLEFTSTAEISLGGTQGTQDGTSTNGGVSAAASGAVNGGVTAGAASEEEGAPVCELWVGVGRAEGGKCERCWNYSLSVGGAEAHPTLCDRCAAVVVGMEGAQVPVAV